MLPAGVRQTWALFAPTSSQTLTGHFHQDVLRSPVAPMLAPAGGSFAALPDLLEPHNATRRKRDLQASLFPLATKGRVRRAGRDGAVCGGRCARGVEHERELQCHR